MGQRIVISRHCAPSTRPPRIRGVGVSEYLPDWVAGISIGAINAAIIAGNVPQHRVQRLRNFWEDITATTKMWRSAPTGPLAAWQHRASAPTTVMFGQPGFFAPRPPQDWFSPDNCVSYYITSALKGRLERLVDFDRINKARDMGLSVGQRADRPLCLLRR
jgi:NTE family protein